MLSTLVVTYLLVSPWKPVPTTPMPAPQCGLHLVLEHSEYIILTNSRRVSCLTPSSPPYQAIPHIVRVKKGTSPHHSSTCKGTYNRLLSHPLSLRLRDLRGGTGTLPCHTLWGLWGIHSAGFSKERIMKCAIIIVWLFGYFCIWYLLNHDTSIKTSNLESCYIEIFEQCISVHQKGNVSSALLISSWIILLFCL